MKIFQPITLDDTTVISNNIAELYDPWSSTENYVVGPPASVVVHNKREYEAIQDHSNVEPGVALTTDSCWLDLGTSNKYKLFDQSITSQSVNNDSIVLLMSYPGRVDSLAVFNIVAQSIQLEMNDVPGGGLAYNSGVISLEVGMSGPDWYSYFFDGIEFLDEYAFISQLPVQAGNTVLLRIKNPGCQAKCGAVVLGLSKELGYTQYGSSFGIDDYSLKSTDDYGNTSITERSYSKNADFNLLIENSRIDSLRRILTRYRATPIVYVGSDQYASTIIYGFYDELAVEIAQPTASVYTLSIKGLT